MARKYVIADLKDDGSWRYVAYIAQDMDATISEWTDRISQAMPFNDYSYRQAKRIANDLGATVMEADHAEDHGPDDHCCCDPEDA